MSGLGDLQAEFFVLADLTHRRDQIEREWRSAIRDLSPRHSTRTIAKHAGVSHVTVHKITKGANR